MFKSGGAVLRWLITWRVQLLGSLRSTLQLHHKDLAETGINEFSRLPNLDLSLHRLWIRPKFNWLPNRQRLQLALY